MLKWQEISFLIGLADLVPRLYHLWHFIHIFSHNTERYTLFSPDPGASAVGISFIEDKWELLFVFCHLFVVYSPPRLPAVTDLYHTVESLLLTVKPHHCSFMCDFMLRWTSYCNVNHTVRFDRWWQSYCRRPRNTCTAVFTWSIKEAKKSFFFFFFDILFEIIKPPANLRRF